MLPLEILKGAKHKKIMIQIKNGDTVNGILDNIDIFMNMKINDVTYTDKNGEKFYKANEIFIRGNNISSINFEENLIEEINKEKEIQKQSVLNNLQLLNKKRTETKPATRGTRGTRGRVNNNYKRGNK